MATNKSTMYTNIAKEIAMVNGVDFPSTLNMMNKNSQLTSESVLNENPHPSTNVLAAKVKLITYIEGNITNPQIVVEQYSIKPNFTGLVKSPDERQHNIWYLPLNKIYAIKFYSPDQLSSNFYNYVYAVPAKIDSSYWSGLKDYTTGVPQEWITALVQYASALPVNMTPNTPTTVPSTKSTKTFESLDAPQKKSFTFNFWGSISGVYGEASSFTFEYVFYPGATPKTPSVVTSTNITATK